MGYFLLLDKLTKGETSLFGETKPIAFTDAFKQLFGVEYDATKRGNFKAVTGEGETTIYSRRDQAIPAGSHGTERRVGLVDQEGGRGL